MELKYPEEKENFPGLGQACADGEQAELLKSFSYLRCRKGPRIIRQVNDNLKCSLMGLFINYVIHLGGQGGEVSEKMR